MGEFSRAYNQWLELPPILSWVKFKDHFHKATRLCKTLKKTTSKSGCTIAPFCAMTKGDEATSKGGDIPDIFTAFSNFVDAKNMQKYH